MKKTGRTKHQEQSSNVLSKYKKQLFKYLRLQRVRRKDSRSQINRRGVSSQSITGKTGHVVQSPLANIKKILKESDQPPDHQVLSSYRDHLDHISGTQGIPIKCIPYLRRFIHRSDFPEPLTQNRHNKTDISFSIDYILNKINSSSQCEASTSSTLDQDYPHVSLTQKPCREPSEAECTISEASFHSEVTNNSYCSVRCSNSAEHQNSDTEEIIVDELPEVSCIGQDALVEGIVENKSLTVSSSLRNVNHLDQPVESSTKKVSPTVDVIISSDVFSTQDDDNNERNSSPEVISEEILTDAPKSNKKTNQLTDSIIESAGVLVDQFYNTFQKLKANYLETCNGVGDLHKSLVKTHNIIDCMANISQKMRDVKIGNHPAPILKDLEAELQNLIIGEENHPESGKEENSDVNMEEDRRKGNGVDSNRSKNNDGNQNKDRDIKTENRKNEVPETTRGNIRSFVLPPEYDPNDTRWTLKHRENDPELNLVKLVPGRNVFIDPIILSNCQRETKDYKSLARKLLVEIFSQSALSVCSLTGCRANAFDTSGKNIRPGLDKPTREAISSFVEKHGSERNWGAYDAQAVDNSLRSKIQEIRRKHEATT